MGQGHCDGLALIIDAGKREGRLQFLGWSAICDVRAGADGIIMGRAWEPGCVLTKMLIISSGLLKQSRNL